MKSLICLFALIAVGQAYPWWHHRYTTESPEEECQIAKDARFLGGVIRSELILIQLTKAEDLKEFLTNKTEELVKTTNFALNLFMVTGSKHEEEASIASSVDRWSPERHLFEALDTLREINGTNVAQALGEAHDSFTDIYRDLRHSHPEYLKHDIQRILKRALRKCAKIAEEGCKEEATVEPTEDPWVTPTWRPRPSWRPRPRPTGRPWPTYDPWGSTVIPDGPTQGPTINPDETTDNDHVWPTNDPWGSTVIPDGPTQGPTINPDETTDNDHIWPTNDPWGSTMYPDESTEDPWATPGWRPRPTRDSYETTWRPRWVTRY